VSNPFDYTWWLASRSAGIVGFGVLSAVSLLGLISALKLVRPATAARLRPWHERLALTGLACIAAHGLLLLADPWLHPGVTGILVPFTMGYRPLWTGLGIIAFYLLAAFGLSFYARRRIGARRWRSAHRFAPAAFLLGAIHAIGAGTDARTPLLLAMLLGFGGAVLALAAARVAGLKGTRPRPKPAARRAASAAPPVEPQQAAVSSRLWT
jgi:methionine sulfoxide reductase heme-binding subunit